MSRIEASVTSPAAVRAEGRDWEAILEAVARERAAFWRRSALTLNPDLIARRLMDERFLPLRGSVGFFARAAGRGLDHRQGLLELEINSGFVFAVQGVGPQSRGPGQAVRVVFQDYTRQRHDQAPGHLKVRAEGVVFPFQRRQTVLQRLGRIIHRLLSREVQP